MSIELATPLQSCGISCNPFSTRHVAPRANRYRFPPGDDADQLIRRLRAVNRWGQIVGPHGSGKSTLLAELIRRLVAADEEFMIFTLHDGQRRLASGWAREVQGRRSSSRVSRPTTIVVDGYEQLGWLSRWALKRTCRRRRWGLVVTAHRSVGFPTLVQTEATVEQLSDVVRDLVGPTTFRVSDAQLSELLATHAGNMRSVLFDLYDQYEARRHC